MFSKNETVQRIFQAISQTEPLPIASHFCKPAAVTWWRTVTVLVIQKDPSETKNCHKIYPFSVLWNRGFSVYAQMQEKRAQENCIHARCFHSRVLKIKKSISQACAQQHKPSPGWAAVKKNHSLYTHHTRIPVYFLTAFSETVRTCPGAP